jgi:hypothetical protein
MIFFRLPLPCVAVQPCGSFRSPNVIKIRYRQIFIIYLIIPFEALYRPAWERERNHGIIQYPIYIPHPTFCTYFPFHLKRYISHYQFDTVNICIIKECSILYGIREK